MADAIQQLGGPIFGRLALRRIAKEQNPMREALVQSLPYSGPMASPESLDNAAAMSPQQRMIATAAQDPMEFAKLSQTTEGGALALGNAMQTPRTRDIVVHPGDELNDRLKLGLKDQESVVVQLGYDQNDRQLPGFKINTYKTTNDNTDPARGGRQAYPSGPLGRVLLTMDLLKAHGQPEMTMEQVNKIFDDAQMTSADMQGYRQYRNSQLAAGVPESEIQDVTDWKMTNGAGAAFATGVGGDEAKRLKEYQDKAVAAVPALKSIEQAYQLVDSGIIAGAGAEARLALVRSVDTLLGRTTDAKSAATDAYLAASGQRVAEAITSFGAGTGLSDADRDFARMITAGKIDMTPQALKMALEILARGKLGDIAKYKNQRDGLQGNFAMLRSFTQDVNVPDSIYGRISPLAKAPEGATDDEKLKFYLNQRPSYLPQGANQQLPPGGGSGPGAGIGQPAPGAAQGLSDEALLQKYLQQQR